MSKKHTTGRADSMGSMAERIPQEQAQRLAATSEAWSKPPRRENENDVAVHRLARAVKGRFLRVPTAGWDSPLQFSPELLAKMLGEAVCHGDPVRVAQVAAMIFARRLDRQTIAEHAMRAFLHGARDDQSSKITSLTAALFRIANMQDRDGNLIEMHRDELRGIARAALGPEQAR